MATKLQSMKQNQFAEIEKVVWYFIRTEYEDTYDCDIPLALKYLTVHFSKKLIGCNMLTFDEDMNIYELLESKLGKNLVEKRFKLLFRASDHDYSAHKFHKFCDGHAPTITIIKSNYGNIFGGYTSIGWASLGWRTKDEKAFLFLIRSNNKSKECPIAFDAKTDSASVIHNNSYGPTFGDGYDTAIGFDCTRLDSCFTGRVSFNHHNELCGGSEDESGYMNFHALEYEVFKIM